MQKRFTSSEKKNHKKTYARISYLDIINMTEKPFSITRPREFVSLLKKTTIDHNPHTDLFIFWLQIMRLFLSDFKIFGLDHFLLLLKNEENYDVFDFSNYS